MLTQENRLRKERDFRAVLGRGRYVSTPLFLLKYTPNTTPRNRYGFVVSTKVSKKAPVRNTIKRRMRAVAKEFGGHPGKGYDIAFIVKKEIVGRPFQEIKEVMRAALEKALAYPPRS